jgi:hypothetical protein
VNARQPVAAGRRSGRREGMFAAEKIQSKKRGLWRATKNVCALPALPFSTNVFMGRVESGMTKKRNASFLVLRNTPDRFKKLLLSFIHPPFYE